MNRFALRTHAACRVWAITLALATSTLAQPLLWANASPDGTRLWQLPQAGVAQQQPLPADLRTPLGSVWKLFVYAYLADQQLDSADYVCDGRSRDEIYCCEPGQRIGLDQALVQSCGLYFAPTRLKLDAAAWRSYWRDKQVDWLADLRTLQPDTQVTVAELLRGLQAIPPAARDRTGYALLNVLTIGRGQGSLRYLGSRLRAKTYSWHAAHAPARKIGGMAGWLANGDAVWLQGEGDSTAVLRQAAPRLANLLGPDTVPTGPEASCVRVNYFSRYPLATVVAQASQKPATPGLLEGAFQVQFRNGNRLGIVARKDLQLLAQNGNLHLQGRLGLNEYVARVLDREVDPTETEAARAMAIVVRSYLLQNASLEHGCYAIDDSSQTQRVAPRPASAAAQAAAVWTDSLVLTGVPVRYHLDQSAAQQLSWQQARSASQAGQGFEQILARTWPKARLVSMYSAVADDCERLADAEAWLRKQQSTWQRLLQAEAGFAVPESFEVCRLHGGTPYSDAQRGRIHVRGMASAEQRLTLAHEYLHLAFAGHPRTLDERFIEGMARRLVGY